MSRAFGAWKSMMCSFVASDGHIEAVVTYCQENEIEMETVPKLISKPLKERLRHEAQRLNYMKASSKGVLPL